MFFVLTYSMLMNILVTPESMRALKDIGVLLSMVLRPNGMPVPLLECNQVYEERGFRGSKWVTVGVFIRGNCAWVSQIDGFSSAYPLWRWSRLHTTAFQLSMPD